MFRKFRIELTLLTYFFFIFNNLWGYAESFDASGNLKVVDKNSAAALTSTQLLDDVVATIAAGFPAKAYAMAGTDGTNARGIKTDTSGELQVDVLTMPNITIGTLPATFAEDAAHGSGDLGIPALFVRNDSNTSLAGTSGDYTPAQLDSNGFLKVTIPVNTVTFSRLEDNAASSADPGVPVLTVRRDTAASSAGTDGDYATFNTDDTGRLWVNGSGVTQPVSAASLPLPTGASTSANQTTVIGHVDGVEGLLTTIDADTGTIAGAVSGTEMQVDVLTLPAIPAGTNNIGDVDVLSLVPGTGATNLGKPEDGAHTTGDTGALVLGVRNDGGSALAGTDGDYIPLSMDSSGYLRVNVAAGGAGDGAIQDGANAAIEATVVDYANANPLTVRLTDTNGDYVAAGAGTQYTEDAAAAADPVGSALMMVRDDALSGQTTADGDNVAARGTDKGELYVKHVDSIPVTDNGGALTVDNGGTFAVQAAQSGTWDEVGINDSGNSITVDGTVTVTDGAGALNVIVDSGAITETNSSAIKTAVELIDDVVDTDGTTLPGTVKGLIIAGSDGTNTEAISVNADGEIGIQDGGNSITVDGTVTVTDGAGSLNVIVDSGAITETNSGGIQTSVQLIDDTVATTAAAITSKGMAAAGTDGTNARILKTDTSGELQIDVLTMPTTTVTDGAGALNVIVDSGAITETNSGSILTSTQLIDDTIKVDDAAFTPATTSVNMAGFEYDDTTPDSVNEGDAGAARMSANRNVYTTIRDAAGNERGANVDASGNLSVAVGTALPAGTNAIGKLAANSGVDIGDVDVTSVTPGTGATNLGKAEDGGAASGDTGVSILLKRGDNITAAETNTDGDYTAPIADKYGRQIVTLHAAPGNEVRGALTTSMTGTTSTSLVAASGSASLKTYITACGCTNGHATQGTYINFQDGNGGTTLLSGFAAAVGGGFVFSDIHPIMVTTANTALYVANVTTGSDTRCWAAGFLAP